MVLSDVWSSEPFSLFNSFRILTKHAINKVMKNVVNKTDCIIASLYGMSRNAIINKPIYRPAKNSTPIIASIFFINSLKITQKQLTKREKRSIIDGVNKKNKQRGENNES